MSNLHRVEREQRKPLGEAPLPPGQAAAVIIGLSVVSWAALALIGAVYVLLS